MRTAIFKEPGLYINGELGLSYGIERMEGLMANLPRSAKIQHQNILGMDRWQDFATGALQKHTLAGLVWIWEGTSLFLRRKHSGGVWGR